MTRNVSSALQAHLALETTTLAMCWKLTRTDGVILGFTQHPQDLIFEGVVYKAASAFTASTTKINSALSVDNMEIDAILDSGAIREQDILTGVYDYAAVQVFIINYNDLTQGRMIYLSGYIGQVTTQKAQFTAELRGLSQILQDTFGRVYTPTCGANLGDDRCMKDLTSFTFSGVVSSVTDTQTFYAAALTQASGYFTNGKITWTSGLNIGLTVEIKQFSTGVVVTALPLPYTIAISDSFTAIAGCDKTISTCKSTFNNVLNFRGFPLIPGMTRVLTTAGTMQTTQ